MGPMPRLAWALAALAYLPAGQMLAVPLDEGTQVPAPLAEGQCVPPGAPPFSSWQARQSEPVVLIDERGRPVLGLFVAYQARSQRIHAIWVESLLASVDLAPERKEAPAWYDRGVSHVSTAVRVDPTQACQWYQPPPRAKDVP